MSFGKNHWKRTKLDAACDAVDDYHRAKNSVFPNRNPDPRIVPSSWKKAAAARSANGVTLPKTKSTEQQPQVPLHRVKNSVF